MPINPTTLKALIDTQITNETVDLAITPAEVGGRMKDTIDYTTEQIALVQAGGDVVGPISSTDNAVARYDLATGKLIQNSLALVSDAGAITTPNNTGSMIPFYYADVTSFPAASNSHGAIAHSHSTGKMYYAHSGAWIQLANLTDIPAAGSTGATGPIGITGATGSMPIGYASTGSNQFYGDQSIEGNLTLIGGIMMNPQIFDGTSIVPDGYNGSLIGPITLTGEINILGSGVLSIL
jgi:hypothetical protein